MYITKLHGAKNSTLGNTREDRMGGGSRPFGNNSLRSSLQFFLDPGICVDPLMPYQLSLYCRRLCGTLSKALLKSMMIIISVCRTKPSYSNERNNNSGGALRHLHDYSNRVTPGELIGNILLIAADENTVRKHVYILMCRKQSSCRKCPTIKKYTSTCRVTGS